MCVRAVFGEVERKVQKSYWEEHSKDLTVESMMLDSRAKDLVKEERPEVYTTNHPSSYRIASIPVLPD